jgi:hypothetical protein
MGTKEEGERRSWLNPFRVAAGAAAAFITRYV